MPEPEKRKIDLGQQDAYADNLKQIVAAEKDVSGRSRIYFDALAANLIVSANAINAQIVSMVKQGVTTTTKQDENIIGVNETDAFVAQILKSPWAEAMKAIATQALAAEQAAQTTKK